MRSVRHAVAGLYAVLFTANLASWGAALLLFRHQPVLIGAALLAYGFGLRHAVDADHIAAIDNVTRKLRAAGQRPVSAGFWFALGHSTVVVLAALAVAATIYALGNALAGRLEAWHAVGGLVGGAVSALFLLAVAGSNALLLRQIWRALRRTRRGLPPGDGDFDMLLNDRGLLTRLFRPLFRLVTRSWHMLPLGFLFGLGFDTATEISLLGISATQAARGISVWAILVFPALFTAGMSLIDTTDGILMLGLYDWASVDPARKLVYNLTITGLSVAMALLIGAVEALGLASGLLGLEGPFWRGIDAVNGHMNAIGFGLVGLFIATWLGAALAARYARFSPAGSAGAG